ncbi:MAG: extracellular solute-binding protein, partial [Vallitaleaceae bacterium]|nr:extracellular solute-binding protein [Vallitaleaceae bacterium]
MKRNLRLVAFLCVLALMFSACAGDKKDPVTTTSSETTTASEEVTTEAAVTGNFPETWEGSYPETVKLEIGAGILATDVFAEGDSAESNQYTRFLKDTLNVEVVHAWQAQSGPDYDQKVNLAIASNDMPDAMLVNATQFRLLAEAGMLADLSDSFNKYASDSIKTLFDKTGGAAIENVTIDGKMLAFPNIPVPDDSYTTVWLRQDWLDTLGLEVPKTATDLKAVAKAFVDNDMSGSGETIGMAGPQNGGKLYATFIESTNNTFGFDPIFTSMDAFPGFWVEDSAGQVSYGSILPETKEALAFLADMYKEGLIDPQIGIRKDSAELVVSGKTGIVCGPWWLGYWPLPDAWANNPDANWQCYMLQNEAGVISNHMSGISQAYVVVRKDYEHPELAIILNDLIFKNEIEFDMTKAPVGNYPLRAVVAAVDEIPVTLEAINNVLSGTKTIEDYSTPEYAPYKNLVSDIEAMQLVKKEPFDKYDIQYWDTKVSPSDFNRMYSIMVGCNAYVGET